jgi:apolipoprotein N-acyltransferase
MLSEYSLEEPPPKALKAWCRRNGKWLVVGGKQPIGSGDSDGLGSTPSASSHTNAAVVGQVAAGNGLRWPRSGAPKERFHNTAFVISPNGAVVFQQAKSRPIQFFADGEPAPSQAVWDSPWGKLGIAICYDASYRQVMDPLIRLGATGLLIPTMDVEHWGEHEHRLNARMAVIRASEYRVPRFRVASSGISQLINPNGRETVTAPFPGPGHALAGPLTLAGSAPSVPLDAWLAPACTAATAAVILWLAIASRRKSQISDTAQDSRPDLPALDSSL